LVKIISSALVVQTDMVKQSNKAADMHDMSGNLFIEKSFHYNIAAKQPPSTFLRIR
jgi:hypothetical protein